MSTYQNLSSIPHPTIIRVFDVIFFYLTNLFIRLYCWRSRKLSLSIIITLVSKESEDNIGFYIVYVCVCFICLFLRWYSKTKFVYHDKRDACLGKNLIEMIWFYQISGFFYRINCCPTKIILHYHKNCLS